MHASQRTRLQQRCRLQQERTYGQDARKHAADNAAAGVRRRLQVQAVVVVVAGLSVLVSLRLVAGSMV